MCGSSYDSLVAIAFSSSFSGSSCIDSVVLFISQKTTIIYSNQNYLEIFVIWIELVVFTA
jgi:hypothetical protein